jgi:hypothetical protein
LPRGDNLAPWQPAAVTPAPPDPPLQLSRVNDSRRSLQGDEPALAVIPLSLPILEGRQECGEVAALGYSGGQTV